MGLYGTYQFRKAGASDAVQGLVYHVIAVTKETREREDVGVISSIEKYSKGKGNESLLGKNSTEITFLRMVHEAHGVAHLLDRGVVVDLIVGKEAAILHGLNASVV